MRDVLREQDGRYTLVVKHSDGSWDARTIGSLVEYLYAPDDPEAVLEKLAAPETRIVSLTVTEGGYNLDDTTGEFVEDDPAVAADLEADGPPKTVFGLVTEALRRRREREIEPFTVMSCDNLQGNGKLARTAFTAFARLRDAELGDWIARERAVPQRHGRPHHARDHRRGRRGGALALRGRGPLAGGVRAVRPVGAGGRVQRRAAAVRGRRRAGRRRRRALRADEAAAAQREPPGDRVLRLPVRLPARARRGAGPAVPRPARALHGRGGDADAGGGAGRRPRRVQARR